MEAGNRTCAQAIRASRKRRPSSSELPSPMAPTWPLRDFPQRVSLRIPPLELERVADAWTVDWVEIDLSEESVNLDHLISPEQRPRLAMALQ
jgi:hypothetical protein